MTIVEGVEEGGGIGGKGITSVKGGNVVGDIVTMEGGGIVTAEGGRGHCHSGGRGRRILSWKW